METSSSSAPDSPDARQVTGNAAPIDGNDVISYLGIQPGPMVGEIMQMLLERRIDEGAYSVAQAFAMARDFALERGLPDPGPPPADEQA